MPAPTETAANRSDEAVRNAEMYPPWLQPMHPTRAGSTHPLPMRCSTPESTSQASPTPRLPTLSWRNFSPYPALPR